MGRETKTFRQTKRAGGADNSNQNYARINRQGPYGGNLLSYGKKVVNYFRKNKEIENGTR